MYVQVSNTNLEYMEREHMYVNLVKIPWRCGDWKWVEDFNFKISFKNGDEEDHLS